MALSRTLILDTGGIYVARAFGNVEDYDPGYLVELRLVSPVELVIDVPATQPSPSRVDWPGSGIVSLGVFEAGDEVRFEYDTADGVTVSSDGDLCDTKGPLAPPPPSTWYKEPSEIRTPYFELGWEVTRSTIDYNDFFVFVWRLAGGFTIQQIGI